MIITKAVAGLRGFSWFCEMDTGCPNPEKCSMENRCLQIMTKQQSNLRWLDLGPGLLHSLQENIGGEWVTVPTTAPAPKAPKAPNYREFVDWLDDWISKSLSTYSIYALEEMFTQTREKIKELRDIKP